MELGNFYSCIWAENGQKICLDGIDNLKEKTLL